MWGCSDEAEDGILLRSPAYIVKDLSALIRNNFMISILAEGSESNVSPLCTYDPLFVTLKAFHASIS